MNVLQCRVGRDFGIGSSGEWVYRFNVVGTIEISLCEFLSKSGIQRIDERGAERLLRDSE